MNRKEDGDMRIRAAMALLPLCACVVNTGDARAPGAGLLSDGGIVVVDPALVPVVPGCPAGSYVRRTGDGWDCAGAAAYSAGTAVAIDGGVISVLLGGAPGQAAPGDHAHAAYRPASEPVGWQDVRVDAGTPWPGTVDWARVSNKPPTLLTHLPAGMTSDCALLLQSGSLSIVSTTGESSSPQAPCLVGVRMSAGGYLASSAMVSFGTSMSVSESQLTGSTFGLTAAAGGAWSSPMPLFLGVATNGTGATFAVSRLPLTRTAAASATALCAAGSVEKCTVQSAVFLLGPVTPSQWQNATITQVGWFGATWSPGSGWTFSLPDGAGFNQNYESVSFMLPPGVMGAQAGRHFACEGAATTGLTFGTEAVHYAIDRAGNVSYRGAFDVVSTAGTAACTLKFALPFGAGSTLTQLGQAFCWTPDWAAGPATSLPGLAGFVVRNGTGDLLLDSTIAQGASGKADVKLRYPAL